MQSSHSSLAAEGKKVKPKSVDLDLLWFGGWKKVTQTYSLLFTAGFFMVMNPMVESIKKSPEPKTCSGDVP